MNIFLVLALVLFLVFSLGVEAILGFTTLGLGLVFLTLGLLLSWSLPIGQRT